MFRSKLYRKYLGIAVALGFLTLSFSASADMSFIGGGGGGGGGGASVTGQSIVNGQGVMRSDASMIAGPLGTSTVAPAGTPTTINAPSFTTDVANAVVFNVYGTTLTNTGTPASDTQLINIAASSGQNMAIWAGYQTVSSAASGAQTLTIASGVAGGAVTIPFMPVTGQTIGVSTAATRLQSATAAGGNAITVNVPSATANGDTLLACISWYPNSPVAALPPQQPTPATGSQRWVNDGAFYNGTNASNGGVQCWHKTAASEPASYTFTDTGSGGVPAGFIADLTNVQNLDVPMTSATGTFAASNVGNDLCIQGTNTSYQYNSANATGGQGCGQIGAFSSATKIYPNFGNLSGSTISSKQYAYGPDQGSTISGAFSSTGGQVVLGSGIYMMCGGNNTSTCLSFPASATSILRGQGRAEANWGFGGINPLGAGTGINNTNLSTYVIIANTDLSQTAWQWNTGSNSVASTLWGLTIEDLTLWGGVGTAGDGGGAAGFTATNFQWLSLDRVTIGNFWGDIVDTLASGTTGYTDSTHFDRAWLTLSGNGDGWKSAGGSLEAQNEYVVDSEIDNNAKNGIELTGIHDIIDLVGNNIQRNDNFNKGSLFEIKCTSCTAVGSIRGNYFENDAGTQNATIANAATGWSGVDWGANFQVGGIGGFVPEFAATGTPIAACSNTYSGNPLGQCVTDSTACTSGTTYTTGGSTKCRVACNGTNWVEGGTALGC